MEDNNEAVEIPPDKEDEEILEQQPEPAVQAEEPTVQVEEPTVQAEEPTVQAEEPTVQVEEPMVQAGDSANELNIVPPEPELEVDAAFRDETEQPYDQLTSEGENEDVVNSVTSQDRPPPMAPSPAIFYPEETTATSPPLEEEFLEDRAFKKEISKQQDLVLKKLSGASQPPTSEIKSIALKPSRKKRPSYPYRSHMRSDKEIEAALRKGPPRHEYCGFLYSSSTQRPMGGYTNYFLPIYSQPPPKQHVQIAGVAIPMDKIHINKSAPRDLLPLSAVKVMWASNRNRTLYRPETIYAYLTRFGPIDEVYSRSVNSVHVIFSDLDAAKAAVTCTHIGEPWDPLIVLWVEPRMYNSGFYYKYAAIENPPLRIRI